MVLGFFSASFSPPNSQKRSQWKMLFHIIEISKNFSRSPLQMLPGHIFLLTRDGEVFPCCGRRMMGSVGQHPRAASQGSILAFPLHLVARGVIPSTPSKTICCRASPSQLPQQLGVVFFFLFGCSVFRAAPSEPLPQPSLAGRRKLTKALLTRAALPDFSRERLFCQRTAGLGQSSPYCYLWSIAENRERW